MTQTHRYQKKPVVIEAMQWDGTLDSYVKIVDWAKPFTGSPEHNTLSVQELFRFEGGVKAFMSIRTLEGTMAVGVGDWVIRGIKDEFYPCKPDIFEATYEAVSSS
jgi:hypothetical protein